MLDTYDKALLEKSFVVTINKSLGEKTVQIIKKRLFEKYGISLHQAINEEYGKLFDILKENLTEGGANSIEKQFRSAIINLNKKSTTNKSEDVVVSSPEEVYRIINYVGDKDMMLILNAVMTKPRLVSEILKACNLPQTSGYRKINKLVDVGLLVISGSMIGTDGRQIFKYSTSFENMVIHIEGNKSKVRIKPKKVGKNAYLTIPFV